jgi:SAM-dependent methyltransferase
MSDRSDRARTGGCGTSLRIDERASRSALAFSPLLEGDGAGPLQRAIGRFRTASRRRRAALFKSLFPLAPETRILDLGGANGTYAHALLADTVVRPCNVCVADIEEAPIRDAASSFGYTPVLLEQTRPLPFADGAFDIVLCSSVLEHVTVPSADIWRVRSTSAFRARAVEAQRRFAAEIRRVAKGYFVQVPYRGFPIETHTWLPLVSYLPRPWQIGIIAVANRIWIKKTEPDFYLPTAAEMAEYFPGAHVLCETVLNLTKSLIAVRTV